MAITASTPLTPTLPTKIDALIVGAGFAGLYQLHKLRQLGLSAHIIERGSGVGGTWYWNRYPGAQCDTPSIFYSAAWLPDLDQEWDWSCQFAPHDEIRSYLEEIAQRTAAYARITFDRSVVSARWDEANAKWSTRTDSGEVITSQYLVLATGPLSASRVPDIHGLNDFSGRWFHTGRWPHEPVDFNARRVAVIGTGSTGVQTIPAVAENAAEVVVLQRTPKFVLPAANTPLTATELDPIKAVYPALRQAARQSDLGAPLPAPEARLADMAVDERDELLETSWRDGGLGLYLSNHADHCGLINQEVNDIIAEFVRGKIAEAVNDPEVAEALTPRGYPIAVNRLILSNTYYAAFNRDNVRLHSVINDPIVEITPNGIRTQDNTFEVDDIIFATGYDAITGSFTAIDVRGRTGDTLAQTWADGPHAHLGVQVSDFPNLFLINGPGSPGVLSNVVTTIEQGVDFVTSLIEHAAAENASVIEVDVAAEKEWTSQVAEAVEKTLFRHAVKANSWYLGVNVPGKKVVFMPYAGGVGTYERILNAQRSSGFPDFRLASIEGREVARG